MKPPNFKSGKRFYEFGAFFVDASERVVIRNGSFVPVTPKAFDTLMVLLERPASIVEKEELMRRVWPDTAVEENNLTQNISALRKALGVGTDGRGYIETVPRRGYRFMVPVRQGGDEISEVIVRERTKSTVIVEEESETQGSGLIGLSPGQLATLTVVVVLVAIAFYYVHSHRSRRQVTISAASLVPAGWANRPSVAVLGLKNLSGQPDADWLSTALPEMLTTELAAGQQLRTISEEDIARLKLDLPDIGSDGLAQSTVSRIRSDLGSDYLVLGSFTTLGPGSDGDIRLDLRVQDAHAGETLATFAETGTVAHLFDLVSRAGARLRRVLRVGDVPSAEAADVRNELPSNPQVAKLYADGVAKLRRFDANGARATLSQAVKLDPQFPLAHSALASALSSLGYDQQAMEEGRKAVDLSHQLSREQQLFIEGRFRAVSNQWGEALSVYQTLFGLFPDNVDYGITLATAETMERKSDELRATLAALRSLPAPAGEDPRIDLAEANWAESTSDFKREESAATAAIARAQTRGEGLTAAEGRVALGTAYWKLGKPQPALQTLEAARSAFMAEQDLVGAAEATEVTAQVLRDRGMLAQARQKFSQTLAMRRKTGDQAGVAASLDSLGQIRWQQGDRDGATSMYDQALTIFRKLRDQRGVASAMNNIANIAYDQGELATAERMYRDSLAQFQNLGNKGGYAQELLNIGMVLLDGGEPEDARQRYEECARISRELGTRSQLANASAGLGDVALAEGKLDDARQNYERALAIRRELGERGQAAEALLDLAAVTIEDGHPEKVDEMLGPALEELRREGRPRAEAQGEAVLARALMQRGKIEEAAREAARSQSLARRCQSQTLLFQAQTMAARVESGSGDGRRIKAAEQTLMATQTAAAKAGFIDRALEARLALGEAYVKGGESSAGKTLLAGVARDGQARGFSLLAQKATRAMD
jgi:eukaryotic-like serine/threonine-protein kinase